VAVAFGDGELGAAEQQVDSRGVSLTYTDTNIETGRESYLLGTPGHARTGKTDEPQAKGRRDDPKHPKEGPNQTVMWIRFKKPSRSSRIPWSAAFPNW
jgi:hypothetical protein